MKQIMQFFWKARVRFRSSHWRFFCKKVVLKKDSLETLTDVVFCEFCEIFENIFFYRIYPVPASVKQIKEANLVHILLANSVNTKYRPSKLIFYLAR